MPGSFLRIRLLPGRMGASQKNGQDRQKIAAFTEVLPGQDQVLQLVASGRTIKKRRHPCDLQNLAYIKERVPVFYTRWIRAGNFIFLTLSRNASQDLALETGEAATYTPDRLLIRM